MNIKKGDLKVKVIVQNDQAEERKQPSQSVNENLGGGSSIEILINNHEPKLKTEQVVVAPIIFNSKS